MVFYITSSVIIQHSPEIVNPEKENKADFPSANFLALSAVDITMWITLWIMCKTLFPEGVPRGNKPVMKK